MTNRGATIIFICTMFVVGMILPVHGWLRQIRQPNAVHHLCQTGWGLVLLSAICCLWYWWRSSDFWKKLPLGAGEVQQCEMKFSWDCFFWGKAKITETQFEDFRYGFALHPYRPDMPDAQHYVMPTATTDQQLTPDWFVPTSTLSNTYVRLEFPFFTIAKYEQGYVFLFRCYCNWDL